LGAQIFQVFEAAEEPQKWNQVEREDGERFLAVSVTEGNPRL
jgi:hypothetical protein